MLPSFIRYFADTSDSEIGKTALEYAKSLCRIAPVRVISLTGGLGRSWAAYSELTMTPMVGAYVNAVCADPSHWIRTITVPMPDANAMLAEPQASESTSGTVELYTKGVRNVLFVAALPRGHAQIETANKYECVVCRPSLMKQLELMLGRWVTYLSLPGADHDLVRVAILGEGGPSEGVYR